MNEIAQREVMLGLLEMYEPLLSPAQAKVLNLYYRYDLSLREIATELNITHVAVSDALRKGNARLKGYEESLGVHAEKEELKNKFTQALAINDEKQRLSELERLGKEIVDGI